MSISCNNWSSIKCEEKDDLRKKLTNVIVDEESYKVVIHYQRIQLKDALINCTEIRVDKEMFGVDNPTRPNKGEASCSDYNDHSEFSIECTKGTVLKTSRAKQGQVRISSRHIFF